MLFFAFFSSVTLFELSESLSSPWLWGAFYGYGILCSILIDLVIKRWPQIDKYAFLLYLFSGFIVFVFLMAQLTFILIAGSIGIVAALLFYFGGTFMIKNKWTSITFAILLPLTLVFISINDFTKKENWEETWQESGYKANFTYFNGEHKIPIHLKKGEELTFHVMFYSENQWGLHFENKGGKYLPMEEIGEQLEFTAEENGEYFIVVRGIRSEGSFVVDWKIASKQNVVE